MNTVNSYRENGTAAFDAIFFFKSLILIMKTNTGFKLLKKKLPVVYLNKLRKTE